MIHGARFRTLPLNVKCPARCAFCYERRVSKLLPHITTEYIPKYDEARFDVFRQLHATACEWEVETGRAPIYNVLPSFSRTSQGISHFAVCDVFSAGLTHEQIEELVKIREGDICLLYSVGLNLDPDFIVYLTHRYPKTFRLHLSIVTFDPTIRRSLMHEAIDVGALRRVCSATRQATFFLMLFDHEQLVNDIDEIYSSTTAENGGLYVHKLYYDRCSPRRVVTYARAADRHRRDAIESISRMSRDDRRLMFSLGGDIQAYARRYEIYSSLVACTGGAEEAVFCSLGTAQLIERYFGDAGIIVLPMESAFGGNIDFVQGCTARDVIVQLERLTHSKRALRRVYLPDAMFWIDDEFDLNGDPVEEITEAFPEVDIEVLPIPKDVIYSAVDLSDCVAFFSDRHRSRRG